MDVIARCMIESDLHIFLGVLGGYIRNAISKMWIPTIRKASRQGVFEGVTPLLQRALFGIIAHACNYSYGLEFSCKYSRHFGNKSVYSLF